MNLENKKIKNIYLVVEYFDDSRISERLLKAESQNLLSAISSWMLNFDTVKFKTLDRCFESKGLGSFYRKNSSKLAK